MKVIHSNTHLRHVPLYMIEASGKVMHPDRPERIESILSALRAERCFEILEPHRFNIESIQEVHDASYLEYLRNVYESWIAAGNPPTNVVPDTFAIRDSRPRLDSPLNQAGHYCTDLAAPVTEGTYEAAMVSAYLSLTAAELILCGERAVYALCRPPGHHAGRDYYGGACYLNNAALAGNLLSGSGRKVAILDIDYHHGNGTQDLFYESGGVFFCSLHADPTSAYPFFFGYSNEKGMNSGLGCNLNLPLPFGTGGQKYLTAVKKALFAISSFDPEYLVVSLGTDTCENDPIGKFALSEKDFSQIGKLIMSLGLPITVIQEGGYNIDSIGHCVLNFLQALC